MRQWTIAAGQVQEIPGPIYGYRVLHGAGSKVQLDQGIISPVFTKGSFPPAQGQPWKTVKFWPNGAFFGDPPSPYKAEAFNVLPFWDGDLVVIVAESETDDIDSAIAQDTAFQGFHKEGTLWLGAGANGAPLSTVTGDGETMQFAPVAQNIGARVTSSSIGGYIRLRLRDQDLQAGGFGTPVRTCILWEGKYKYQTPSIIWTPAAGGPFQLVPFQAAGGAMIGSGVVDFAVTHPCDALTITPVDNIAAAGIGATGVYIDVSIVGAL